MNPSDALPTFTVDQKLAGVFVLRRQLPVDGAELIWLAHDEVLGKDVSLHFIPRAVRSDERAMSELRQEIKRNRQLIHPGILRVYDLVEESDWAAISMDWFEGETLAARLHQGAQSPALDPKEIDGTLRQICQTLDEVHRIQVVHRNLSPRNIIVDPAGKVLIAKFGVSRVIEDAYGRLRKKEAGERHLSYVSPQQLDGEPPNKTDDIYALGVTIHELLTGQPPFSGSDIVAQIRKAAPPAMAERRAKLGRPVAAVPGSWEKTVAACLAKQPADRPQSAGEVAGKLELGSGGKAAPERASTIAAPAAAAAAATTLAAAAAAKAPEKAAPAPAEKLAPEKAVPAEQKPIVPADKAPVAPEKAPAAAEKPTPAPEKAATPPEKATTPPGKSAPSEKSRGAAGAEKGKRRSPMRLESTPGDAEPGEGAADVPDIYPSLYPKRQSSFPTGAVVVLVLLIVAGVIFYNGWKGRRPTIVPKPEAQATPDEVFAKNEPSKPVEALTATPTPPPAPPSPTPVAVKPGVDPLIDAPQLVDKGEKPSTPVANVPAMTPKAAATPEPIVVAENRPPAPKPATPAATPAATPLATPLATPVATPAATPVATPEPVKKPVATPEPITPPEAKEPVKEVVKEPVTEPLKEPVKAPEKNSAPAVAIWPSGQKPPPLDEARKSAAAADKAYQDLLKLQESDQKALTASKKGLEEKTKSSEKVIKASEELIAERDKQKEAVKTAENAAREAREAAEEQKKQADMKARQLEEVQKSLTAWEKKNEKKLKARDDAEKDLKALQDALAEKQKSVEESASKIAAADQARAQAAAALKASEEESRTMAEREAAEATRKAAEELAAKKAGLQKEMEAMMKQFKDRLEALEKTGSVPAAAPAPVATPVPVATPAPTPTKRGKKGAAATTPTPPPEQIAIVADVKPPLPVSAPSTPAPIPAVAPSTPVPAPAPIAKATPAPEPPAPTVAENKAPKPAPAPSSNDIPLPTDRDVPPLPAPDIKPDTKELTLAMRTVTPGPNLAGGPDTSKSVFESSLGMKFAPVGDFLVSVFLVRVQDFDVFAKETNFKPTAWRNPGFKQAANHPVVNVSWNDATAFCKWLTERDRKKGVLQKNEIYRLPMDLEWSQAVGLPEENGKTPEARDMGVPEVFPWGTAWPPPPNVGNYTGEETGSDVAIRGYDDNFAWTSPVGSFPANKFGLYDMGGNVWQWCQDDWNADGKAKVLRGASWYNGAIKLSLLSSCRIHAKPEASTDNYGFRVVKASELEKSGRKK